MAWTAEEKKIIDNLAAQVSKAAGRGEGHDPRAVFGDPKQNFNKAWQSHEWDQDRLAQIAKAYNGVTPALLNKGNGRQRISGIGPALVKMAAMSNPGARSVALANGMSAHYNDENLENEHGFVQTAKAATQGSKALGFNGEVRKVALADNSGQAGGYIVPPQFVNRLQTIAGEDSFIEGLAQVLPMNSRTAEWPMLDITTAQAAGITPYAGGILATWQPEAQALNQSQPQFRSSTWTAWDLEFLCVSSNQLLADNGIGLDALLTQLFGWAMSWYLEYAYLRGTGSGSTMPLGILNAGASLNVTRSVAGRFTLADAATMMSHLQARSWGNAVWVMHQSVLPQMIQMVDGGYAGAAPSASSPQGNRLAWMTPFGDQTQGPAAMKLPTMFLNGRPVYFTEKLPQLGTAGDVMLVDFSNYVIGKRLDVQIDVSPHVYFANNQLAWRVICRADGKPWMNGVITDAEGFTISPFVVLH